MCSWCLVFLIDQSKLDEIGKQAAGMGAVDRNKSTDSAIIAQLMSCYLSYWASHKNDVASVSSVSGRIKRAVSK